MEVTCQLRLERVSKKKGTAPIRLTFHWKNKHLRLSTGKHCRPADWNTKAGRVKGKPGLYAGQINQVLARWTQAGVEVHQEARRAWQRLDEQQMETAIRARYQQLLAEARGLPVSELHLPSRRPVSVLEHLEQWCTYMEGRVSTTTGWPLSRTYLRRLRHLHEELEKFSQQQAYPLTFPRLNREFYDQFQHYQLVVLGNGPNTFAGYIKNIKNFLSWCEARELPTSPTFHTWQAREQYVGADFLTAAELQR